LIWRSANFDSDIRIQILNCEFHSESQIPNGWQCTHPTRVNGLPKPTDDPRRCFEHELAQGQNCKTRAPRPTQLCFPRPHPTGRAPPSAPLRVDHRQPPTRSGAVKSPPRSARDLRGLGRLGTQSHAIPLARPPTPPPPAPVAMAGSDLEPLRAGVAALPSSSDPDSPATPRRSRMRDLLRNLDRRLSNRSRGGEGAAAPRRGGGGEPGVSPRRGGEDSDELGDGAPPEWALLLVGCLLGLATGICVAAFNRGVSTRSPGELHCFLFFFSEIIWRHTLWVISLTFFSYFLCYHCSII
jgi:hypothetical protein